jgi:predicted DNA-binding transcriptional regulator AlpA
MHAAALYRWACPVVAQASGALDRRAQRRIRKPQPSATSWPEYVWIEEISAMGGGVSERTLCRCMRPLKFPKPLGKPRSPKLWRTAEVVAWVEAQARLASTLDRQE